MKYSSIPASFLGGRANIDLIFQPLQVYAEKFVTLQNYSHGAIAVNIICSGALGL